ncbi:MAG: hypothetical protein O2894_13270 [Planctomycetota bacterium]|nr:hypothetical protein [Planctomycetota bacterium]
MTTVTAPPPVAMLEDYVQCVCCQDTVPRTHTVLRTGLGRLCWFCHTEENLTASHRGHAEDEDEDEDEDEEEEEEDEEADDWDEWDDD